MQAIIRVSGTPAEVVLAKKEVSSLTELDAFLMDNGLLRDIKDLREDLKWDGAFYFINQDDLSAEQRTEMEKQLQQGA